MISILTNGSPDELVSIGVEPGTLRFRVDVITHYTKPPQLVDYISLQWLMSLEQS